MGGLQYQSSASTVVVERQHTDLHDVVGVVLPVDAVEVHLLDLLALLARRPHLLVHDAAQRGVLAVDGEVAVRVVVEVVRRPGRARLVAVRVEVDVLAAVLAVVRRVHAHEVGAEPLGLGRRRRHGLEQRAGVGHVDAHVEVPGLIGLA